MAKHGKKYLEAAKLVEADRRYEIAEAAELLPKLSTSKFDGTVEAHLRLGVDPRHADQLVRGTVVLPHGTGRTSRVIVFAQGEKAQEALRAGADDVGDLPGHQRHHIGVESDLPATEHLAAELQQHP